MSEPLARSQALVDSVPHVGRAVATPATETRFGLDVLAGRLVELSCGGETAALTAATLLVSQAQRRGEPTAWIAVGGSTYYPPDLAEAGVDLAALPTVRVRDGVTAARVADQLLRSGAFGLVVMDLGNQIQMRPAVQTRLNGLANKHHTAVVCLTRKAESAASLGSLVSLRAVVSVDRVDFDRFHCGVRVVKDKRGGPGWGDLVEVKGVGGLG